MPLGIDFSSILSGFGRQVGRENRAKSEENSILKGIKKMMKKKCVLEGFWVGNFKGAGGRGMAAGGILDPLNPQFIKEHH